MATVDENIQMIFQLKLGSQFNQISYLAFIYLKWS